MTVAQEVADLDEQIRDLQKQRMKLNMLPDEPAVGSVVKFSKTFSRKTYSYAAVHTDAGWFVTGQSTRRFTWSALVEFVGANDLYTCDGFTLRRTADGRNITSPVPPRTWVGYDISFGPDDEYAGAY